MEKKLKTIQASNINQLVSGANELGITKDDIVIRFKININDFFQQPRISDGFGVQKSRIRFYYYFLNRIRPEMDIWQKHL